MQKYVEKVAEPSKDEITETILDGKSIPVAVRSKAKACSNSMPVIAC